MAWYGAFFYYLSLIIVGLIVFKIARNAWRILRVLCRSIADSFVVWSLLRSSISSYSMDKSSRMHAYLCKTEHLDIVSMQEVYNFLLCDVEAEASVEDVQKIVQSYSHLMLCREKIDGSLRGIMGLNIVRKKEYTILRTDLTFFKKFYRGGSYHYLVPGYLMIKELLARPFTPIYAVGKVYSYKAYLLGVKMKNTYPRYDRETPKRVKTIINEFAESVLRPKETYDPKTNILTAARNYSHLKENLTVVTEQDLKNPHVKFFVERNPGWMKGDCLVMACYFDMKTLIGGMMIGLRRFLCGHKKRELSSNWKRPRRLTFQDQDFNLEAKRVYESEVLGSEETPSDRTFSVRRSHSIPETPCELNVNFSVDSLLESTTE